MWDQRTQQRVEREMQKTRNAYLLVYERADVDIEAKDDMKRHTDQTTAGTSPMDVTDGSPAQVDYMHGMPPEVLESPST